MKENNTFVQGDLSNDPPLDHENSDKDTPRDRKGVTDDINALLNEGLLEQKQRRIHRGAAVWFFGSLGVAAIIMLLIPLEYFIWSIAFCPSNFYHYEAIFKEKLYLITTTIILISAATPVTISIAIIRMISSNKNQNKNSEESEDKQTQEISGVISPIFDFIKNILLMASKNK